MDFFSEVPIFIGGSGYENNITVLIRNAYSGTPPGGGDHGSIDFQWTLGSSTNGAASGEGFYCTWKRSGNDWVQTNLDNTLK